MDCENRSCSYSADWEVETVEGVKKRICTACYFNEGWDKQIGEGVRAVPLDHVDRPELIRQDRKWVYSNGAAGELTRLYIRYGSWKPVAELLGVKPGHLSVYITYLRKRGFEVLIGRRNGKSQSTRMASLEKASRSRKESIGRRVLIPLDSKCPDCGCEYVQQVFLSSEGSTKIKDRR